MRRQHQSAQRWLQQATKQLDQQEFEELLLLATALSFQRNANMVYRTHCEQAAWLLQERGVWNSARLLIG